MADSTTITLSEVGVRIRDCWVLEDISLVCGAGEWILLEGPSGSGKSTLLRAINGLRLPTRGSIEVLGSTIPGRSRREARSAWRRTGTVLQDVALFETKTARQNIELALRTCGRARQEARDEAILWLARLGIADKAEKYPCELSGGQCQRVALARALGTRPRLLLLDEPTSALDQETARTVLGAIRELVNGGTTAVVSTHRVDEVADLCHQHVALRNGRLWDVKCRSRPGQRLQLVSDRDHAAAAPGGLHRSPEAPGAQA
jgi:ABC-type polar amino acid transport system ATPase subunit